MEVVCLFFKNIAKLCEKNLRGKACDVTALALSGEGGGAPSPGKQIKTAQFGPKFYNKNIKEIRKYRESKEHNSKIFLFGEHLHVQVSKQNF